MDKGRPLECVRFALALRGALLAGSLFAVAVVGRPTIGQDLTVSGGTVTGNTTAATFDNVFVSGTAADGTPSTYNAAATLTVNNRVEVLDAGIFNVNAPVTIGNYIYADTFTPGSSPGSVRLNPSGTLTAFQGSFVGPGSLVQSGGNYSLDYLFLDNAGAIDYQAADSITSGVGLFDSTLRLGRSLDVSNIELTGSAAVLETGTHGLSMSFLSVNNGAAFTLTPTGSIAAGGTVFIDDGSLTLDRDVSGLFQMQLFGSGATLGGSGRYETATMFGRFGATLPYRAGDAITNFAFVSDATIDVTGTTLSTGGLYLSGSTAAVAGTGNYTVQTLSLTNGATLVFDADDSVSGFVGVADSTFVLDANLVTNQIYLTGSAAALTGTGSYTTSRLVVSQAAGLSYRTGDSITGDVFLFDSVLTLDKPLELTGDLYLSGPTAGLGGPHDYRVATLSLSNNSLSYDGGDSITSAVFVSSGTLTLDKDLPLANSLTLTSATLSGSGRYATPTVILTSSTLAYRTGDSITSNVQLFDNAALVLERSLDLTGFLSLSGSSTIGGTGSYTTPQVFLSNGATLAYDPGDSITSNVFLFDSVLTLNRDLTLAGTLNLTGSSAALSGAGAFAVQNLFLDNASLTFSPGDAIANTVTLVNGVLTLDTALSIGGQLSLNGSNAAIAGPGTLAVNGLQVVNGALLTARAGDSITGDVFLQNGGDLVAQTPLGLKSLLIDAGVGSVLTLQAFSGTGPINGWGLALDGDRTSDIASFLADGRLLTPGAPDGVTTIFDAGSNRTFLVAVPEPTTWALAAVGMAALVVRRCRSRSRARRQG
ncbi:MAG: beta strand repeat-containing protein [Planctomycetota bacterium]